MLKDFEKPYLAGVNPAARVPGAQEGVGDRLKVRLVALLIAPHRQPRLQLLGALPAAVACGPPADHGGERTLKRAPQLVPAREADWDHVF